MLLAEQMGRTVAGYYSSADEYSRLANPYSNEREMFYVVLDGSMVPGSDWYEGVLAHEFQHMIHWADDRNEETWVNEGCSELSAYLNGYDPGGFDGAFLTDPDVQLTTWPELHRCRIPLWQQLSVYAVFSGALWPRGDSRGGRSSGEWDRRALMLC